MAHELKHPEMPPSVLNAVVVKEFYDGHLHSGDLEQQALDIDELHLLLPPVYIKDETDYFHCDTCKLETEWLYVGPQEAEGVHVADLYKCLECSGSHLQNVDVDAMHKFRNEQMDKLVDWAVEEHLDHEDYMRDMPFGD